MSYLEKKLLAIIATRPRVNLFNATTYIALGNNTNYYTAGVGKIVTKAAQDFRAWGEDVGCITLVNGGTYRFIATNAGGYTTEVKSSAGVNILTTTNTSIDVTFTAGANLGIKFDPENAIAGRELTNIQLYRL